MVGQQTATIQKASQPVGYPLLDDTTEAGCSQTSSNRRFHPRRPSEASPAHLGHINFFLPCPFSFQQTDTGIGPSATLFGFAHAR